MGMKSLKDVPSTNTMPEAEMMWMQTSTERKETLDKVCKQVVDRFIEFTFHGATNTDEHDQVHEYMVRSSWAWGVSI